MRAIVILTVTIVVSYLVLVGVASIANARLLAQSAVPTRYANIISESDAEGHVHDVHVQRGFLGAELNGYSDERSYIRLGPLRIPISSREWFGWMLVAMAGATLTVWVPKLRPRHPGIHATDRNKTR